MKAKPTLLVKEDDLSVDLTLHDVPASLISEFAEKIVRPYYNGNLNATIQDLIKKAIAEQDFILSHITHVRNSVEP
jgi:tagatose-1,6-bisphosphate aldolase non-catalytic subunit AgaZ/GatZ